MKEFIQATVTILALVNPAICAQMFAECTGSISKKQKVQEACKTVLAIAIVLFIAAFFGTALLNVFGISLEAFSCAGGGILVWIGAGMIKSAQSKQPAHAESHHSDRVSVTPLILFAASPGTITGVITVAVSHSSHEIPITAIVGVAITMLVLALVFLLSIRLTGEKKEASIAKKMVTSYMGVIVIAMGVQFILSGVKAFML
ncbi:MarC family protein [Vibrio rumoiensis]|uniref:UPF0056 membrane protein n=1 Tax=Vibrio rumoiensis 1S-45 TaxID=1188252 RepID=A0A1E5E2B0_9VIBR|nr:MarC family protein [Vibrio rumoiensis]OEF25568.1 hypothetical protein A1QC_01415 [Vibrio rumoiensis 1S-45]